MGDEADTRLKTSVGMFKRVAVGILLCGAGALVDRYFSSKEIATLTVQSIRQAGKIALLQERLNRTSVEAKALAIYRKNLELEPQHVGGTTQSCMPTKEFSEQTGLLETNLLINLISDDPPRTDPKTATPTSRASPQ